MRNILMIFVCVSSLLLPGCFDSHSSANKNISKEATVSEVKPLPDFLSEIENKSLNTNVDAAQDNSFSDENIGYLAIQNKKWEFFLMPDNSIKKVEKTDKSIKKENNSISINVRSMPLKSFLQYYSELVGKNIVISPSIEGDLTIQIHQLPWDQALILILQTKSLGERKVGKAIYIASLSDIAEYDKKQQELDEKAPMKTLIFRMNYAKASEVAKLLQDKKQSLVPKQGHVAVDNRTNSLLVRANENQLTEIGVFLKRLDIPIQQVLIEARIVNIDDDYEKELGVRFGITSGHHISGSLDGASELAGGTSPADIKPEDRLNVDLPALNSNAGRLGIALFKLTKGTLLDLELSALESEGRAEIISNPRLMTANQQTATIEAGEEIPYQESVAQGVTSTSFKKAVLRLEVSPQITPDKKIILHLKVNQDKRSNKEVQGVPSIDTRHVDTQVLVGDGQTVVLGGIYEHTKTNGIERVPFFADLPFLGVLFRHQKTINNRRELLIFVTPTIVNSV